MFRCADGRITVISGKLGDDVRPGTYKAGTYEAILKQTKMKEESE